MTTRRRIARRPTTALRPRLTWRIFDRGAANLTGGTNQAFDLGAEGSASTLASLGIVGDYTIRRVRWALAMRDEDVETNGLPRFLNWGMTVVSSDAFSSGVGAIPDPANDNADWWGYGSAGYFELETGFETPRYVYEYDVRSMRKVNENSQIPALVLSLAPGRVVSFSFFGRILVSHGRQ